MPAYWPRPNAHGARAPVSTNTHGPATTRLVHRRGSGIVADLYLAKLDRVVELLAHELEHIVERLEGIDVVQMTRRVPQLVWSTADGTVRDEASDSFGSDRRIRSGDGAEVISAAEMAKTYLIRATALAATLTLGVRLAAAPERCGIQVVPQHDPNSTAATRAHRHQCRRPVPGFRVVCTAPARRHERAKRHLRLRYEHEPADDGVSTPGR